MVRWDNRQRWFGRRADDGLTPVECVASPLINRLVAGYRGNFTDLGYPPRIADEYVYCPDTGDVQAFAARIDGDSMAPAYLDGDVVVFTPNAEPRTGQACFVRFAETHETTFKVLYIDADGLVRLQPLNPEYPAQRVGREELDAIYPAAYRIHAVNGRGR